MRFLCKEKGLSGNALGHLPVSRQCGVFKAALEQAKVTPLIRILQCNIRTSKGADDVLYQLTKDLCVNLISEQYKDRDPFWFSDSLGTTAFWARNKQEICVRSH